MLVKNHKGMDWELTLIELYYWVCEAFENGASSDVQRYSNNSEKMELGFSDEEAATLYLFGIMRNHRQVKSIHTYGRDHLSDWFPRIPSYEKFNARLNRLNPLFAALCRMAAAGVDYPGWLYGQGPRLDAVVDSMPVMLAQRSRSCGAKVARGVADKGKCASKDMYYHGVKLHFLGLIRPLRLPAPLCLRLSGASENDNTVFKEQIAPAHRGLRVFGDRIYHDEGAAGTLLEEYDIEVLPCQKRKRGQAHLFPDQKWLSYAVSVNKQTVEAFFSWINEKTGIQIASKVRSTKGLLKHVFGKLTAALLLFKKI